MVVPIVLDRDLFSREVGRLERVRGAELGDRLVDPADAPEIVSEHVTRMRHAGRHPGIGRAARQRLLDPPAVFVRVRQVVVRGEVGGRERERLLVEPDRGGGAALPALRRIRRFRLAALQPQLLISRVFRQGLIERRSIRGQLRRVARRVFGRHLQRARVDVRAVVIGRRQRSGAVEGGVRSRRGIQLRVRDRQAQMRHGQLRVEPQRLVERPRRLEPHIGMQVREPLIVKRLRLLRRRADRIVRGADAGPNRGRPRAELDRDRGRSGRMRMLRLLREREYDEQPGGHGTTATVRAPACPIASHATRKWMEPAAPRRESSSGACPASLAQWPDWRAPEDRAG